MFNTISPGHAPATADALSGTLTRAGRQDHPEGGAGRRAGDHRPRRADTLSTHPLAAALGSDAGRHYARHHGPQGSASFEPHLAGRDGAEVDLMELNGWTSRRWPWRDGVPREPTSSGRRRQRAARRPSARLMLSSAITNRSAMSSRCDLANHYRGTRRARVRSTPPVTRRTRAVSAALGGASAAAQAVLHHGSAKLRAERGMAALLLAARGGARYASNSPWLFTAAGEHRARPPISTHRQGRCCQGRLPLATSERLHAAAGRLDRRVTL